MVFGCAPTPEPVVYSIPSAAPRVTRTPPPVAEEKKQLRDIRVKMRNLRRDLERRDQMSDPKDYE